MQRVVLGMNVWKERTAGGGWLFRWHDLHYLESRRRTLWDQLEDNNIHLCPRCGHQWLPKDPTRPPVSCPQCKVYLQPKREPVPAPGDNKTWEFVREFY